MKSMGLPGEISFMATDVLLLIEPQLDPSMLPSKCKMLLDLLVCSDDPDKHKALRYTHSYSLVVDWRRFVLSQTVTGRFFFN